MVFDGASIAMLDDGRVLPAYIFQESIQDAVDFYSKFEPWRYYNYDYDILFLFTLGEWHWVRSTHITPVYFEVRGYPLFPSNPVWL